MDEHALLHLATVPGAADELDLLGEVEGNEVLGVETLFLPVRVGAFGAVHHHEVRFEGFQLFIARANEHVLDEVSLPGHLCDDAHGQTGIRVGTAEAIDHKQALAGELFGHQGFQM